MYIAYLLDLVFVSKKGSLDQMTLQIPTPVLSEVTSFRVTRVK